MSGVLDVLRVQVGKTEFDAAGPWPDHIEHKLLEGFKDAKVGVERAAKDHLQKVLAYVEHFHGRNPWNGQLVNPSNRLQRRSGKGIQSIKDSASFVSGDAFFDGMEVRLSTGTMGIHETGGTIRPSRAKYLTIPLPAACDRRGVPLKKSSRDWPSTFVIRSRRGNLLIVQKNSSGGITPLYLLKSSVRIPARLGLEITWNDYATKRLEAQLINAIERALDNVRF